MDEEIRDAFAHSGTLHVLAISGTHVAILAALLLGIGRLLGLPLRAMALTTIAGILAYTLLTDCRPPVIRATLLVCLFASAGLLYRRPSLASGLALAAIAILLWNPTDLFDVGTQLSFLGVLAVAWATRAIAGIQRRRSVREHAPRAALTRTLFGSTRSALWRFTWEAALVSLAAALFTTPLIAARFHMVSPISVVVNLVLTPLSTLLLWTGYLDTAGGLVAPWCSRGFAFLFDGSLTAFLGLVERAARVRFSHAYVPGPPEWWLAGYYALLLCVTFVRPCCRWRRATLVALGGVVDRRPRLGIATRRSAVAALHLSLGRTRLRDPGRNALGPHTALRRRIDAGRTHRRTCRASDALGKAIRGPRRDHDLAC